VYGELGRIDFQCMRNFNIIRYWVKLLQTNENKYIKKIYLLSKSDCDRYPNRKCIDGDFMNALRRFKTVIL